MPNIATLLKNEIARVARKEVRAETQSLKKAVNTHRGEIAALKRNVRALEQKVRQLGKSRPGNPQAAAAQDDSAGTSTRFSAKSLASQRRRLGLSAHDCGLLVGASGQSIYKWEAGKAKPRAVNLPGIAALRAMGKKDAAERLAALA
jgi:DNA-binding transcriptional regulator YiaG